MKFNKKYLWTSIDNPPKGVKVTVKDDNLKVVFPLFNKYLVVAWSIIFFVALGMTVLSLSSHLIFFELFLLFVTLITLYQLLKNSLSKIELIVEGNYITIKKKYFRNKSLFELHIGLVNEMAIVSKKELVEFAGSYPRTFLHEELSIKAAQQIYVFGNELNAQSLRYLYFVIEREIEKRRI